MLIKKILYGVYKFKPCEVWDLSAREVVDMYEAHVQIINEDFDQEMQRTAWFTSLIMNSSGNYKKPVKPEKLYIPVEKQNQTDNKAVNKQYVDQQREELKRKFNIE